MKTWQWGRRRAPTARDDVCVGRGASATRPNTDAPRAARRRLDTLASSVVDPTPVFRSPKGDVP